MHKKKQRNLGVRRRQHVYRKRVQEEVSVADGDIIFREKKAGIGSEVASRGKLQT
jgi:hypothetical protein